MTNHNRETLCAKGERKDFQRIYDERRRISQIVEKMEKENKRDNRCGIKVLGAYLIRNESRRTVCYSHNTAVEQRGSKG